MNKSSKIILSVLSLLIIISLGFFLLPFLSKIIKNEPLNQNVYPPSSQALNSSQENSSLTQNNQQNQTPIKETPIIQNNNSGTIIQINSLKEPYFIIALDKENKAHTLAISDQTFFKVSSAGEGYGVKFLSDLKLGDKISFKSKGEQGKVFNASEIILIERQKAQEEPKEIFSLEGKVKSMSQGSFILFDPNKNTEIIVKYDDKTKFLGGKISDGDSVIVSNPSVNLKGKKEIYAQYIQKL